MFTEIVSILFTPSNLVLIMFGALVGMILGAIPGLSGTMAITICLPMTFSMPLYPSICLLCGLYIGSASGSFIGSILLGIPGTPSSLSTVYDGYELTKKGDPVRALSAGLVSNAIGTVPGLIVAMFACNAVARLAVRMGPWEYFALIFSAITMVAALARGNMARGMIVASLAFMLGTVGYAPLSGTPRFVFTYYLAGGFDVVSVMMGMFAGKMILMEYARNQKGTDESQTVKVSRFRWPGKDLWVNLKNGNIIISFIMGLWIGFLPGMGGALSNVMAYSTAKNRSRYPEKFGTGCIDGVIAPEVANNASVGGAIIPFLSLGIPGDGATAILLSAMMIQGVQVGPMIIRNQPEVLYTVLGVLMVGAIFIALVQAVGMPLLPMVLKIPYQYLYPFILVICFIGAYSGTSNMFILYLCLIFTLVGVFMDWAKMPMGPFMLAFVLGKTAESNLRNSVSYARGDWLMFFKRPASCALILLALAVALWPYVKGAFQKNAATKPNEK